MLPSTVTEKLRKDGYIARQNIDKKNVVLDINLGGPKSLLNGKECKGLILLNREVIFGTCQVAEIKDFRNLVMREREGKWTLREGVPGDKNGVSVGFSVEKDHREFIGNTHIECKINSKEPLRIYGYQQQISFENQEYIWEEIEYFIAKMIAETSGHSPGPKAHLNQTNAVDSTVAYTPIEGDFREAIPREIKARRGQQQFRNALLKLYENRCVVTKCAITDILEAAHIKPYRGDNDHHVMNGFLLRSDIHTLFDLHLLGVEPVNFSVELHPDIAKDVEYGRFAGKLIDRKELSIDALETRYKLFCLRKQFPA